MEQNPTPQNYPSQQFYTLETLKNVTAAAAAITLVCGLIMSFYKQGTKHEINLLLINSIALSLCFVVVLANQYKKDTALNRAQHILLIFFNSVLLYASVAGATGITSSFKNAQENSSRQQANIFSYVLPTRPLYGVTQNVYDTTKNALVNANQIILATEDIAQKRNDTLISAVIEANESNVKSTPREAKIRVQHRVLTKLDTAYGSINSYWVYLGQIIDEKWQPQNFNFTETPKNGDNIIANKPVFKRDAEPMDLGNDYWRLGKVIGVVNNGQKLKVVDIRHISGDNYWAKVTD